jgi:hypothetical protein
MPMRKSFVVVLVAAAGAFWLGGAAGQVPPGQLGYADTPFLPGGKWRVHDGTRPQPKKVETDGRPSDAIVLFDGKDLSQWQTVKGDPAPWKIDGDAMVVTPKGGDIVTRDTFGDCQLHVEWVAPTGISDIGQDRGNSGVFFMGRYEVQVLDTYENRTYPDGQAGALYGQFPPLVNASRKAGEWQTYDIIFIAPRFEGEKVSSPALVTVLHNGVVVHHAAALLGTTFHRRVGAYTPHPPAGPIKLQDHGNPVRYRNIWIRRLQGYDGT